MDKSRKGLIAASSAMVLWGLLPVYWKQMSDVPAYEILSHRIIWSLVASSLLLIPGNRWAAVRDVIGNRKNLYMLMTSGTIIAFNWLLYIWAVNKGYIIQCSLGYFINPLLNVLLGFLVFKDSLRKVQWWAIGLAAAGVGYQIVQYGRFPWISLGLACSFALYGLIRKLAPVESLPGLFVETAFLSVPAGAFLLWTALFGSGAFPGAGAKTSLLLMGTGVITSVPLIWFVWGARNLSLVTIGLLQFVAPTLQFGLGYWVYHESFSSAQMVTFAAIWGALAIYTVDSFVHRAGHKAAEQL